MTKIFHIGWKDLKIIFRDRAALILMLVAPFANHDRTIAVIGTLVFYIAANMEARHADDFAPAGCFWNSA